MVQSKIENVEEQFNETFSKNEEKKNTKKVNYDVKNYLNTRLSDDETQKDIKIRIINVSKDSGKAWDEIKMHYMPSLMKSYVCSEETKNLPEGTERLCPFCAIRKQVQIDQQNASKEKYEKLKEIYKQNGTIDNFVLRVIDRSDESFGPKFWKCTKKALEQIKSIYKINKEADIDIFDFYEGKDITLTIKKTTDAKGKQKNEISSIQGAIKQTPVSKDESLIEKWINDEKIWNDVYVVKPFDYLKLIIDGKKPYFDKTLQKWVEFIDKKSTSTDTDDEDDYEEEYQNAPSSTNNHEEEDLPF